MSTPLNVQPISHGTASRNVFIPAAAFHLRRGEPFVSMPPDHDPRQNLLLAALNRTEQDRVFPYLELIRLPLGTVLHESGDALRHVYFPTDGIVSLLNVLKDGTAGEISVIGYDGVVGASLLMGGVTTPNRAVVRSAGCA